MAVQSSSSSSENVQVRCCMFVVGSTETNLHNYAPLERELVGAGLSPVAPPKPLRTETVLNLLNDAARADVCLLLYDHPVTPDELAMFDRLGIFQSTPELHPASFYHILWDPAISLPSAFRNPPTYRLNRNSLVQLYQDARVHVLQVRNGIRPPLEQAAPLLRARFQSSAPVDHKSDSPPAESSSQSSASKASAQSRPKSSEVTTAPVPMPPSGPVLYLSYAFDTKTERPFNDTASEMRRLGLRAQINSLGFLEPATGQRGAALYKAAVDQSEWYVLLMNFRYFARASERGTGVDSDIRNIESKVFRNPFARENVIPIYINDGPHAQGTDPQLILGLDGFSFENIDPKNIAESVNRAMTDRPRAEVRSAPVESFLKVKQSGLVRAILANADEISHGSTRNTPRVPVGALLLSMLHTGSLASQQSRGNTASWLLRQLPENPKAGIARITRDYFPGWDYNNFGNEQSQIEPALPLSYNAFSALYWARLFAERVAKTPQILCGSHLLTSLLHSNAPWTENVEKALQLIGLNPAALRANLARDLQTWNLDGDPELWQLWNALPQVRPRAGGLAGKTRNSRWTATSSTASVSADVYGADTDQLDITPDVEAFAKVLASWKLEPPLALGLFGDWGSGKTFFMKELKGKIESHSKDAREGSGKGKLQKDLAFCKYIVQVEFNAWHYSEGDLWACLVDHIFTNLRLTDRDSETEVARRRKAMLTQLQTLKTQGETEQKRKQQTEEAIDEARKQAQAAEEKLHEAQARFTELSVRDIWTAVTNDEKLREVAKEHLKNLGYNTDSIKTAQDVRDAFENAKSLGGRTQQVFSSLARQLTNPYAWLAYLLALGVPAIMLWLHKSGHLVQLEFKIGAAVGAVVSAVAGFIPIYRSISERLNEVLDTLEKPRRMAEQSRRLELQAIEDQIADLTKQRHAAQQREKDIEHQKEQLNDRINALNADRMLAEFLQDRAASDDYRKKLGTLALIRRDFERLADLMKSQRIEADNEKLPDPPPVSESKEVAEKMAKTQADLERLRVNRIVLYIDDLDRCSPKQVVDVLQAIHLLLAFPLFVVVVGVDARWVHRSIGIRCKELLRPDRPDENAPRNKRNAAQPNELPDEIEQEMLGIATPRDYLEKIFQVPFWLRPMTTDACRDLIEGIVRPERKRRAATSSSVPIPPAPAPETPPLVAKLVDTAAGSPAAPVTPDTNVPDTNKTAPNVKSGDPKTDSTSPVVPPKGTPVVPQTTGSTLSGNLIEPEVDSNATKPTEPVKPAEPARSLELSDDELGWMQDLAPIIGRSPRAVKRFINCYRLFKAVLPEERVDDFLKQETRESVSYSQVALFFLAIIVGDPEVASVSLNFLAAAPNEETCSSAYKRLADVIDLDGSDIPASRKAIGTEFKQLFAKLGDKQMGDIHPIVVRALRFSFHSTAMAQELEQLKKPAFAAPRTRKLPAPA